MSRPTPSTIKRLYALSRNRCAFPKCPNLLVCDGNIVAEVCHIRGLKPGSPRHDPSQTDDERNAFENLVVLCSLHHTVIDTDQVAYTVERLVAMKHEHESASAAGPEPDDRLTEMIIESIQTVASFNQSGGITAGVVNVSSSPVAFARPRLEEMIAECPTRVLQIPDGVWEAPTLNTRPTRWHPQAPMLIGDLSQDSFEVVVPRGGEWRARVPYALVRSAWAAPEGIAVRLDGRLVLRPECGLRLESWD